MARPVLCTSPKATAADDTDKRNPARTVKFRSFDIE